MKKKVYYKLNRYQVTKVEVETVEQEQAVKMLNRDTDRFAKSEDTYRERYASLDEMYEESGFEPADDSPTPEEQFLENEKNEAIKRLVSKHCFSRGRRNADMQKKKEFIIMLYIRKKYEFSKNSKKF